MEETTTREPDEEEDLRWVPVRQRRKLRGGVAIEVKSVVEEEKKRSLVEERVQSAGGVQACLRQPTEEERRRAEEAILERTFSQFKPLVPVAQLAAAGREQGPSSESAAVETGWAPERAVSGREADEVRKELRILVSGQDVPGPVRSFEGMRLPAPVLEHLSKKGISKPTPIQMQGLPVALSGRDLLGLAFTGSGKTLVFVIPMVVAAVREEMRLAITGGEGPFGLLVCPSRELAKQNWDICEEFSEAMARSRRFPRIRNLLATGGASLGEQLDLVRRGVHNIVATPGRLKDLVDIKKKIDLRLCKYFCLDEADHLVEQGFEEDLRAVMDHFSGRRQTLMFSATMPRKVEQFAKSALIFPVEINVGRAGAANLDVVQEVEYVRQEARIVYLLECLQKTEPPVLIFCENKADVDDIYEYLLLKGVDVAALHGSKSQEERDQAVKDFKAGRKDVLVATDVASKGLDFPDVKHVINFDCPKEIDTYVHRIGRTGRCGKTGVATTFINRSCQESVLLDLKRLLIEAKQRVPLSLQSLRGPDELEGASQNEASASQACPACGGLGHSVTSCSKLAHERSKLVKVRMDDRLASSGSDF